VDTKRLVKRLKDLRLDWCVLRAKRVGAGVEAQKTGKHDQDPSHECLRDNNSMLVGDGKQHGRRQMNA
jgi:hypothetical protein